ncbi:MAG: ABC transporter ATP-binding protein [Alphaproteobacteria bacterium]|nr:ABC transporter ATP-binding protein [Alphaproteobacteria bacterium]
MNYNIELTDICKSFGNLCAAKHISISAHKGVIALLGPNGAGKSTLMNMIAGFITPDCGCIKIMNTDICQHPLECKQNIGFLPEGSPLYADMSVKAFLDYVGALKNANRQQISQAIDTAQIKNVLSQKIETLSKGYQRRVGFAQSILTNPPILLLDEPTDGLDPNQKEHIQKVIRKMGAKKTILISTHLLDEAETIADRIIIMHKGTIMADGTLTHILHQSKSLDLAEAFKKLTSK